MTPERAEAIAKAMANAHQDLSRLGKCSRMLVSRQFFDVFHGWLREQSLYRNPAAMPPLPGGAVYFRGLPVVACEQLEDLEYSFVK